MRIECLTTFLDGRERFEVGDIFTVDDERGAYFVKNGWAKKVGDETPAAPAGSTTTDLDIHNVIQGHTSEVKNG